MFVVRVYVHAQQIRSSWIRSACVVCVCVCSRVLACVLTHVHVFMCACIQCVHGEYGSAETNRATAGGISLMSSFPAKYIATCRNRRYNNAYNHKQANLGSHLNDMISRQIRTGTCKKQTRPTTDKHTKSYLWRNLFKLISRQIQMRKQRQPSDSARHLANHVALK